MNREEAEQRRIRKRDAAKRWLDSYLAGYGDRRPEWIKKIYGEAK